jgi:hypothetical protein
MIKKILKILLITGLVILVLAIIWTIREMRVVSYEKANNPLVIYLEDKFHNPQRAFIKQSFEKIPPAKAGQMALVIGADIAEGDLSLPLEKGYDLIAFESWLIYYTLIVPNHYPGKVKITTNNWDFETLPQLDIVMARFILPLYKPEDFPDIWQEIKSKIKINGYFIGNFFDPDWDLFPEETSLTMTFHTKKQVLELFKDYEILALEEVNNSSHKLKGNEHYYEVFARKIR